MLINQYTEREFDIFNEFYFKPGPFVMMDYTQNTNTHNEQKTAGVNLQSDFLLGSHYLVAGLDFKRDDIDGTEKSYYRTGAVVFWCC